MISNLKCTEYLKFSFYFAADFPWLQMVLSSKEIHRDRFYIGPFQRQPGLSSSSNPFSRVMQFNQRQQEEILFSTEHL